MIDSSSAKPRLKFRISEKRPSKSRPTLGILNIAMQLINQHGDVVQEGEHQLMVPLKPEDGVTP